MYRSSTNMDVTTILRYLGRVQDSELEKLSKEQSNLFICTFMDNILQNTADIAGCINGVSQVFAFSDPSTPQLNDEKLLGQVFTIIFRQRLADSDIDILCAAINVLLTGLELKGIIDPVYNATVYSIDSHADVLFKLLAQRVDGQSPTTIGLFMKFLSKFFTLFDGTDRCLVPLIMIREGGFNLSLMNMIEDKLIVVHSDVMEYMSCYRDVLRTAHATPLNLKNESHKTLATETLQLIRDTLGCNNREGWKKAGFSDSEWEIEGLSDALSKYLSKKMSILDILDLIHFLKDQNLMFKKPYTEQLMFTDEEYCLPLILAATSITKFLVTLFKVNHKRRAWPSLQVLRNFILAWSTLYFYGMANLFRIWKAAKAQSGDFCNIENLLMVLTTEVIFKLSDTATVEDLADLFGAMSYQDLRKYQLQQEEKEPMITWRRDLEAMESRYARETEIFIKEQRVLSLMRGSWGFAENPLQFRDAKAIYCAISPNRQNLLYKVFLKRPAYYSQFETECKSIDLNSVLDIVSKDITPTSHLQPGIRLINLTSRSVYKQITLIGRGEKPNLLTFFTNKAELGFEWSDGLSILIKKPNLSEMTRQHVDILTDLRLKIQMMDVVDGDIKKGKEIVSDEADISEIDEEGFYYS